MREAVAFGLMSSSIAYGLIASLQISNVRRGFWEFDGHVHNVVCKNGTLHPARNLDIPKREWMLDRRSGFGWRRATPLAQLVGRSANKVWICERQGQHRTKTYFSTNPYMLFRKDCGSVYGFAARSYVSALMYPFLESGRPLWQKGFAVVSFFGMHMCITVVDRAFA